jgi:hypothetical protein
LAFPYLKDQVLTKNRCAQADWSASSGLGFPF